MHNYPILQLFRTAENRNKDIVFFCLYRLCRAALLAVIDDLRTSTVAFVFLSLRIDCRLRGVLVKNLARSLNSFFVCAIGSVFYFCIFLVFVEVHLFFFAVQLHNDLFLLLPSFPLAPDIKMLFFSVSFF